MTEGRVQRNLFHTIDWYLIACWFVLIVIGWLSVYSSSHSVEGSGMFALAGRSGKQLLWMGISLIVGVVILFWVKPYIWEEFALPGWIFVLLLLGFFGGAAGALLGMLIFRHKTRRWYFWAVNLAALGWQLAAVYALLP